MHFWQKGKKCQVHPSSVQTSTERGVLTCQANIFPSFSWMSLIHCRAFPHTSSRGGLPSEQPLPALRRARQWITIFMNEKTRRREARTRSLLLMPSNNANILWMILDGIWRVGFEVLLFWMECTGEKKKELVRTNVLSDNLFACLLVLGTKRAEYWITLSFRNGSKPSPLLCPRAHIT